MAKRRGILEKEQAAARPSQPLHLRGAGTDYLSIDYFEGRDFDEGLSSGSESGEDDADLDGDVDLVGGEFVSEMSAASRARLARQGRAEHPQPGTACAEGGVGCGSDGGNAFTGAVANALGRKQQMRDVQSDLLDFMLKQQSERRVKAESGSSSSSSGRGGIDGSVGGGGSSAGSANDSRDKGSERGQRNVGEKVVRSLNAAQTATLYDPGLDDDTSTFIEEHMFFGGVRGAAASGLSSAAVTTAGAGAAIANSSNKQRAAFHSSPFMYQSDATLSCPGCFTAICYECQRDPHAPNQWFAANVLHCTLGEPELVEMPKPTRKRRKSSSSTSVTALNATGRAWDSEELMRPIVCATCETEVGLQDRDGFYHLWGVFPSPPLKLGKDQQSQQQDRQGHQARGPKRA